MKLWTNLGADIGTRTGTMIELLKENGIDIIEEGNKHCAPGWVQLNCPFCGDSKYHMGFNLNKNYFHCYKCGWHSKHETLSTLLDIPIPKIKKLLKESDAGARPVKITEKEDDGGKKIITLPLGTKAMARVHRDYLKTRGFNANQLEMLYGLKGTGHLGDYKFRIIAPIFDGPFMASYQGRDITGRSPMKYKVCSKENEVVHYKKCLYGLNNVTGNTVIVVEGIADAWRLGRGSVATFGTQVSQAQIRLLASFRRVVMMFDAEDKAQRLAERVGNALSVMVPTVDIICANEFDSGVNDPGEFNQDTARGAMKELLT